MILQLVQTIIPLDYTVVQAFGSMQGTTDTNITRIKDRSGGKLALVQLNDQLRGEHTKHFHMPKLQSYKKPTALVPLFPDYVSLSCGSLSERL